MTSAYCILIQPVIAIGFEAVRYFGEMAVSESEVPVVVPERAE